MVLDKLIPNTKGAYVNLPLPHIDSLEKVAEAQEIILQHLAMGAITTDEAEKIFNLIEFRCETNEKLKNTNMLNQLMFGRSNDGN